MKKFLKMWIHFQTCVIMIHASRLTLLVSIFMKFNILNDVDFDSELERQQVDFELELSFVQA